MTCRLVIHIPAKAGLERDALTELKSAIARVLAPEHSIQGHAQGKGHLILTIHSEDPQGTWERAKSAIAEPALSTTYVFYAPLDAPKEQGSERWLWPPLIPRPGD